jgi:hypothetical protein
MNQKGRTERKEDSENDRVEGKAKRRKAGRLVVEERERTA